MIGVGRAGDPVTEAVDADADATGVVDALRTEVGGTVVLVTGDGVPLGTLALTDRLRPHAPATTAALTALTGTAPSCSPATTPGPPRGSPSPRA